MYHQLVARQFSSMKNLCATIYQTPPTFLAPLNLHTFYVLHFCGVYACPASDEDEEQEQVTATEQLMLKMSRAAVFS